MINKLYWRCKRWFFRSRLGWSRLRRLQPLRADFGYGTGQCIDRFYIERFLDASRADIQGTVLEIGDRTYTLLFGEMRVENSQVLHAVEGNDDATIVGDLTSGAGLTSDSFDCLILTQTLNCVFEVGKAIRTSHRILKSGGVALITLPGVCQISRYDASRWGDFWRFTPQGAFKLFAEVFGEDNVIVESHGNVLAASALLHGLVVHELRPEELSYNDPDYPVVITVRAAK